MYMTFDLENVGNCTYARLPIMARILGKRTIVTEGLLTYKFITWRGVCYTTDVFVKDDR